MSDILKNIYSIVNDVEFNFDNLDDKIILQKIVYLLMNMRINVGDYGFEWNEYGPYSIALDFDFLKTKDIEMDDNVEFSDIAIKKMYILKKYIKEIEKFNNIYSKRQWLQCIASLHYLKYVLCIKESNILYVLKKKFFYLNNDVANKRALKIINEIEVL